MNHTPECMIFLLSKAYQKGQSLVQKRLRPYGLTNIQYVVLEVLWYTDGLTGIELGKHLMIDKATLSGVLDRMSEAGWIDKRTDDKDRRAIRIYPTQRANEMRDTLVTERQEANEELLTGFTVEERVLLRRFLLEMA